MTERNYKDIPNELKTRLVALDGALTNIETKIQPLLDVPFNEISEKISALDRAKVDLVAAYSINSLFWMYLNVCGVQPKEHGIKQEMDRIRGYMNRVKEIQDKALAPKINKDASKRFVKSALWKAAHDKDDKSENLKRLEGARIPGSQMKRKHEVERGSVKKQK